jgi:hypothetical protein
MNFGRFRASTATGEPTIAVSRRATPGMLKNPEICTVSGYTLPVVTCIPDSARAIINH